MPVGRGPGSQGGKFPEDEQRVFDLLHHGVRLGCEYVDMETCWSLQARGQLLVCLLLGHALPVRGPLTKPMVHLGFERYGPLPPAPYFPK